MISNEQQVAIDTILKPDVSMVLVSAVAGSGKTYTLTRAASAISGNNLYLAYNKSAELDATPKFGPSAECKTVDGFAYKYIIGMGLSMQGIKPGKRIIDYFTWRNIDLDMPYEDKLTVIDYMERYFTSKYVSLSEFLSTTMLDKHIKDAIILYVKKMAHKEIPCTFGFSRKYFHILLDRGVIQLPKYKLVMLDEIQDSNECTLEIFKLIPAQKKIGVGDMHQSIYAFNHCVNGFKYLSDVSDETVHLTKSFRVSTEIAQKIEKFGQKHLDNDLHFVGTKHDNDVIDSSMYIARTNGSLIAQMIRMNNKSIPYNLSSKDRVDKVFGLLLTIISLKPGCKVYSPEHKFLLDDMEHYYRSEDIRRRHKTLLSYIATVHAEDRSIKSACKTIVEYGGKTIWDAFNIAKAHSKAKVKHKLMLCTAHSSKGLEADQVTLDDDMIPDFLSEPDRMSDLEIQQELNLIYVATTRAKKELLNCNWLTEI